MMGRPNAVELHMSENVESLILEHLRHLRNEIAGLRSEMHEEFRDVKLRLGSVETIVVSLRRDAERTRWAM